MDHLTTSPSTLSSQSTFLTTHTSQPFHATPLTPQKILDIGCGTGHTTFTLAKTFPTAQVIGVDLKYIDASGHGRLSNLMYIKADIAELVEREDMLFWPGTFDYIFQRGMMFSVEGWKGHMEMMGKLLAPGGWVEVQEVGVGVFAGVEEGRCLSDGCEWFKQLGKGCEGRGIDVRCGERLAGWLGEAGLVDVKDFVYELPFGGPGADDVGVKGGEEAAQLQRTIKVHQDLVRKFCSKNKSPEALAELEESVAATYGKCREGDFIRMHVAIGQKQAS